MTSKLFGAKGMDPRGVGAKHVDGGMPVDAGARCLDAWPRVVKREDLRPLLTIFDHPTAEMSGAAPDFKDSASGVAHLADQIYAEDHAVPFTAPLVVDRPAGHRMSVEPLAVGVVRRDDARALLEVEVGDAVRDGVSVLPVLADQTAVLL